MMNDEAMERMVLASVGDGTTLYEVMTWVFGRRRCEAAMCDPANDPEFVRYCMRIDALVNKEWKRRGVSRVIGPYASVDKK